MSAAPKKKTENKKPPLIVGLGASAGGQEALQRFFKSLPKEAGDVVFVVVMHLDPTRKSSLAEILQRESSLPVKQVTRRTRIQPGHVYVIPPNKSLSLDDGCLALGALEEKRWKRAPIDLFFRSLARAQDGCAAVVLSGSGCDGAMGLKTVKEKGGLIMAQDPEDAEYDSMPRSAINTGLRDFILPADELSATIMEFAQDRLTIQVPKKTDDLEKEEARAFTKILAQLRTRTGHDFSDYKRSTVLRRIGRRMQMNRMGSFTDYLAFLRKSPGEAEALLKNLLISVTDFFRDPEAWEALAEKVIPNLFQDRPADQTVRAWVPGCASGEEAYSLAILLLEEASRQGAAPDIQIFASDMDEEALARGRNGLYPEMIVADVSEERLQRFFTREDNHFRVKKEVRERVLFASHSLLNDPPFSKLDLISCRNVLIYVNAGLQKEIFNFFHYGLNSGGFLFLGNAETPDKGNGFFQSVDKKHRIYRKKESSHSPSIPVLQRSERAAIAETAPPAAKINGPSEADRHRDMLERHYPPSILVDSQNKILHLSEQAGRYLFRPGGKPSDDILLEIRPELRLELQVALVRAFDERKATSAPATEVSFNGHSGWVHLIVKPSEERDQALIIFAEVDAPTTLAALPEFRDHKDQLERENRNLRERLQTTVEEFESSREEMKASNEELQSINEEYKSTAEELETSKEELQSLNEELETVNQELNSKIEEVSKINSDLQNLMASTDIGTLFLDRDMCIQRYTPRVAELFSIVSSDIGRPISHFTQKLSYDTLEDDARNVLRDLSSLERTAPGKDGKWFLIRLLPYRTVEDHIEGVVITFVDITEMRRTERALHSAKEYAETIVDTVRSALLVLDDDLRTVSANKSFYRMFRTTPAKVEGRPFFELSHGQWDVPKLRQLLEEILPEKKTMSDFEVEEEFEDLGRRSMLLNARRLENGNGILLAIEDVTERRHLTAMVAATEQTERQRLAAILHDDLQQLLCSVQMRVKLARQGIESGDKDLCLEELGQARDSLKSGIRMTRSLTLDLSPPVLKEEGLVDALRWLAQHIEKLHDLTVDVEAGHEFKHLDSTMRTLIYQVVRELLFNVVKHAGINRATLRVARDPENRVIVTVEDRGEGFDPSQLDSGKDREGFGLASIRERLKFFRGSLEIDSAPGKGTRVIVTAPAGSTS